MRNLSIILLFCLAGCNPAKKVLQANKDFETIGAEWAKKNPCANDSIWLYKPGRIDSVPVIVPVKDTAAIRKAIDSVSHALAKKYSTNIDDCNRQVNEAYNTGYDRAAYECSLLKVADKLPDTMGVAVTDNRKIKAITDLEASYSKDLIAQKTITAHYLAQRNWAYIILGIALLLLIILIIILLKK